MKKLTPFLKALLLVFSIKSYGQIGINTDNPRGSIDFSENSGGLVLPKSESPETYVRKPLLYRTSKSDNLAPLGTLIYDTKKKCMRVTSDIGKWSECIGSAISGKQVLLSKDLIKGVGIQNSGPKGLLDLNDNKGVSDMGFLVPQVNDTNNLPANQLGSFVFDKSKKCLKFVFKDYDDKNKWSGCMNSSVVSIGSADEQKEYQASISSSITTKTLNLTGAIGIGTESPHGILDASQCSKPMILPVLDNALQSKNILTDGTLVYDKSARAPRIVYKDEQNKLHWSSRLPGADYCGYNASNGGGKVYAIKEGIVKFQTHLGSFFLNPSNDGRTLGFWVKGDATDSGVLYAESWLSSGYLQMNYIGFDNGKLKIKFQNSPKYHNWEKTITNFKLDGKWHYFVFEKTGNEREISIYIDDMSKPIDTVTYSNDIKILHNATVSLGAQKKCCTVTGNPSYNVFKGKYTVVSFWKKNLNEEERILSKYGYPRDNYGISNYYGIYVPHYGDNYVVDYSNNNKNFYIGDGKVNIVPADDLPVPFGRNVKVFTNVSIGTKIKLTNNQTGDEFTVTPTQGTAERVVIYESLDAPTNAEDHNLYKDFFGIDIKGASSDFTYNIKYKRKKLTCEDELSLYMRNYHDGFEWTKLNNATLDKTTESGYNIFSFNGLSENKEFIIGYDYN